MYCRVSNLSQILSPHPSLSTLDPPSLPLNPEPPPPLNSDRWTINPVPSILDPKTLHRILQTLTTVRKAFVGRSGWGGVSREQEFGSV